jgi:hypothetical protein
MSWLQERIAPTSRQFRANPRPQRRASQPAVELFESRLTLPANVLTDLNDPMRTGL